MSSLRFGGLALVAAAALFLRKMQKKEQIKLLGGASAEDKPITIAYWNMCGLGQPLRLLLAYSKLPFRDVRYQVTQEADGSWNRSHWTKEKFTLGLDFPNLPYLIHGDYRLTESNAILRYLAELTGLGGSTPEERGTVAMMLNVVFTLRNWITGTAYKPTDKYPEALAAFKAKLPPMLTKLQDFIGDDEWLCDFGLTAPDFHLAELLRQTELMLPGTLAEYPGLDAYVARFQALPAIKEYMESPQYIDRPCNNPMATFK